jgi:type II secretory pathway predicted ATPase ExeA
VLAGQPEFDRKLDAPDLRQLKQRIVLRCSLHPFTQAQAFEYIATRMERAGMPDQDIIPLDVLAEVHVRSQGIPRLINAICDNLLLTAFAMESKVVTMPMLEEVTEDMRLEWGARRIRGGRPRYTPEEDYEQSPFSTRGD